jgi:hypothetical protein
VTKSDRPWIPGYTVIKLGFLAGELSFKVSLTSFNESANFQIIFYVWSPLAQLMSSEFENMLNFLNIPLFDKF